MVDFKFAIILLFSINAFAFDWVNPSSTQCYSDEQNFIFEEADVQLEMQSALQTNKHSEQNIYYSNALEYARSNPRDLFCLHSFFQLKNQSEFSKKSVQYLQEQFTLLGGLHSKNLHHIIEPKNNNSFFLFNSSLLQMARYNFSSLWGLVKIALQSSGILFFSWGFFLMFSIYLTHAPRIGLWTRWGIKNPPTGSLSSGIVFLIFSTLCLFKLQIALLFLFILFTPLLHFKHKRIFFFMAFCFTLYSISLGFIHQYKSHNNPDSPEQISRIIWLPAPDTIPKTWGPITTIIASIKKNDLQFAAVEAEKLEYQNPNYFWPYLLESKIFFLQNQFDQSIEALKEAFSLGLASDVYFYNLNQIYSAQRLAQTYATTRNKETHNYTEMHKKYLASLPPVLQKSATQQFLLPTPSLGSYLSNLLQNLSVKANLINPLLWLCVFTLILYSPWPQLISNKSLILSRNEIRNHLIHYRRRKILFRKRFYLINIFDNSYSLKLNIFKALLFALLISSITLSLQFSKSLFYVILSLFISALCITLYLKKPKVL